MINGHSKKTIREALETNNLSNIVSLATANKRVIPQLIRFSYERETLSGWRAIKAIGLIARQLIKTDYNFLRETIRKLLWSLSDESGGIGWSAPEILGEIVSADPNRFSDVIPLIAEVYEIEEKIFRPGVLYAFGRIAETDPVIVQPYKQIVTKALTDADSLVRIYAIELLKTLQIGTGKEVIELYRYYLENLLVDRSEVWVYKNDCFVNIQVGEAASAVLKYVNSGVK